MESLDNRFVMLRHLAGGLTLQQLAEHLGTTPAQAESFRGQFLASLELVAILEPVRLDDEDAVGWEPSEPAAWAIQLGLLALVTVVLSLLALAAG